DLDAFIVAHRAAHRTGAPARQLAAWLARAWDGSDGELDPDAALDAGHVIDTLDDGFDVGARTVRSLAATAGGDAQLALGTVRPVERWRAPHSDTHIFAMRLCYAMQRAFCSPLLPSFVVKI